MTALRIPSPFSSSRRRTASPVVARVRGPEPLESRAMMATFSVVAPDAPVNGSTFRSLQEALAVASDGDAIRISPLAVIDYVDVSTKLAAVAAINDTTITTKAPVPFGQVIELDNGVDKEQFAVVGITPAAGGQFTLTLSDKLTKAYAANDTVATTGDIAITKSVTLASMNGMLPGSIVNPNGLQVLADDVVIRNLIIGTGINLMPGADNTAFRNCWLGDVSDTPDADSGGRTFLDNVFYGNLILRDDADATTIDRVSYNQFQDVSLRLEANDGVIVRNNTFSMIGAETAITVNAGEGVLLRQNEIRFSNPRGTGDATPSGGSIGILATGGGGGTKLDVQMLSNRLDTGGLGIGILLDIDAGGGANFAAKLQGNDFHWNTIGLLVDGDGTGAATALGTVDAGGGSLLSHGGNNFRGFTVPAATANTAFPIYLANGAATAGSISAQNNLWQTSTPTQLVKDSTFNSAASTWPWGAGRGTVSVGAGQLSGNQQFVQALYGDFLGRTGSSSEIDFWAGKITGGTATRNQVATSIITSPEANTLYVTNLYHTLLQRTPDAGGLNAWVSQLNAGASKESVAAGITASDQYFSMLSLVSLEVVPIPFNQSGATGDSAYVTSLYVRDLERLPENSELSSWLAGGPMTSSRRLSVAQSMLTSTEFRNLMIEGDLYYRLLNRRTPVPSAEVSSWNSSGLLLTPLQIAFASSNEYFARG